MSLNINLEREQYRNGLVKVEPGSRRAPDKQVVTVWFSYQSGETDQRICFEVNKSEAEAMANALKSGVRR